MRHFLTTPSKITFINNLCFTDNSPASKVTDEDIGERFENLTGRKATSMQNSDVIISC